MKKTSKIIQTIKVQNTDISIMQINGDDYISLTDICKGLGEDRAIHSWLRSKNTLEFLGIWEQINNEIFKLHEFVEFKNEAGSNRFNPSPKQWISATGAIGIVTKSGKYGGTYAHKDIAFEFGAWLNPEFKLYLIKEFQRLKTEEAKKLGHEFTFTRFLSKAAYKVQTDSVKRNLIPPDLSKELKSYVYADEADLLNLAVFGETAKEWRDKNPELAKQGNARDFAEPIQNLILFHLETLNAEWIDEKISKIERLRKLNQKARDLYELYVKSGKIFLTLTQDSRFIGVEHKN